MQVNPSLLSFQEPIENDIEELNFEANRDGESGVGNITVE